MANGYQPEKGEQWGEEPVAHTFDLTPSLRSVVHHPKATSPVNTAHPTKQQQKYKCTVTLIDI